ncbi:hypothetical protein BDW74DRAFT_97631 [Aspergillus multicolor]|uniref:uncharacterized protein n=1 Tax=Aspergillus multicolor TaxID=41759 RepID=UPI003CCD298E
MMNAAFISILQSANLPTTVSAQHHLFRPTTGGWDRWVASCQTAWANWSAWSQPGSRSGCLMSIGGEYYPEHKDGAFAGAWGIK